MDACSIWLTSRAKFSAERSKVHVVSFPNFRGFPPNPGKQTSAHAKRVSAQTPSAFGWTQ